MDNMNMAEFKNKTVGEIMQNYFRSVPNIELSQVKVIQDAINENGYRDYLEIGVMLGATFFSLDVLHRWAVEPDINPFFVAHLNLWEKIGLIKNYFSSYHNIYCMDSDEYFNRSKNNYDVIFIDGYHERNQVVKDINNSLKVLAQGGTIFVHDTNPKTKAIANPLKPIINQWSGDVWRGIIDIRCDRDDIEIHTVDIPYGLTVIKKGKTEKLDIKYKDYTFEQFDKERDFILNIKK